MLNVRLSKLNIYTRPFMEKSDQREHVIIFSCRKCMGVKLNTELFSIIKAKRWDLLPDELFTLLLYYEIIIHDSPGEFAAFYGFRALVAEHLATATQIISIEGLNAALDLYGSENREQQVIARLSVTLVDETDVLRLLELLRQVAVNDTITVRSITIKLGSPALINDETLLNRFRAFSKKIPLNFMLMEENYSLAEELYDLLLENEIWGDYFFDLNEYATYAKTETGVEKATITGPDDSAMLHLPMEIKKKKIPNDLFSRLSSCIEKMIFIKYKVWPV